MHKKVSFDEGVRKSSGIFYCAIEKLIIQLRDGSGFKTIDDGNVARPAGSAALFRHSKCRFSCAET
jgi:hypothetical protein